MSLLLRGGPVEVVPGVYQLRARAAQVTALIGDDGIVLVDSGGRGSLPLIASGLAKLGAALASTVRTGGMTPAVIDVITSDEAVDHNAASDLDLSLTPLSTPLAKLTGRES